MARLISNRYSRFYSYWLSWLFLLLNLGFILYANYFQGGMQNFQYTIAIQLILCAFCFFSMYGLAKVSLTKDYLIIEKRKESLKIPIEKIDSIYQGYGFFTRLIYFQYQDETGTLQKVKFMPDFTISYKAKSHPVVSEIWKLKQEKLKTD